MLLRLAVLVVLVLVTPAHAQQPSAACKLLQIGEIESAMGRKASTQLAGGSQNAGGMVLDTCSVELGVGQNGVRKVSINIYKDTPLDAGELLRNRNAGTAREGQWKETGARLEQKTVGNAMCILAGRPGTVGHSICSIPRAKTIVEVDVTAPVQELPSLDTVGALVQKAVTRQ
jgi:hypothetical protein